VASASKIVDLQQEAKNLRAMHKSRNRTGFSRQQSRATSSPRGPKRPPAFRGVFPKNNTSSAVAVSPSRTLAEWKRRRVRDKEAIQFRTDADLHDDQVYFTNYAMRLRARKMFHRELKAATLPAKNPNSHSTQEFSSSKGKQIILLEGGEKNELTDVVEGEKSEVADAVERLLGRMRGLGEASECVKGLAATAGLAPKPTKAPALSGKPKPNNNHDVEKDLFTLQVRQLKGQLKDSVFGVIREQEVQADIAKTMADAFKHIHGNSEKVGLMQ
jgi:hypothetical protein